MDNTDSLRDALILYATTPNNRRGSAEAMCMAQAQRMTEDEIIQAGDAAQIRLGAWIGDVGRLANRLLDGDRE